MRCEAYAPLSDLRAEGITLALFQTVNSSFLLVLLSAALPASSATNAPRATPRVDPVLELQVLLDRAHFSPGEIDGQRGSNLQAAMTAYKGLRMKAANASERAVVASLALRDQERTRLAERAGIDLPDIS